MIFCNESIKLNKSCGDCYEFKGDIFDLHYNNDSAAYINYQQAYLIDSNKLSIINKFSFYEFTFAHNRKNGMRIIDYGLEKYPNNEALTTNKTGFTRVMEALDNK
jgi:hypothetical protein